MSYQIGIDTLHLRPTPRLAHTEYCDHEPLIRQVQARTGKPFHDAWQYDFIWSSNDGPVPWGERGRVTDMGHAVFMENGSDFHAAQVSPFKDVDEVLAFDAVREYGLPDFDKLVAFYEKSYQDGQRAYPNQLVPGGYYKTLVSGAIAAFGWDLLLEAAAEQDAFERVLDSIFRLSLHHFKAWAETSIEVFNCHDDMVWSEGPFMSPAFYRRAIFPRYRELWAVLKRRGKKVVFTADANYTMFLGDVAAAGADGFIFEPMTDLATAVRDFGQTHVLIGSALDCRTLTFGTKDQIRAEIDTTLALARGCRGFMFAVGNHLPANIPLENAEFFYEYLSTHWDRT